MRLGFLSMAAGMCLLVAVGTAPGCSSSSVVDDGDGGNGAGSGEGGGACLEQELCNSVDDDCDGAVDEDCECVEGESRGCYGGPAGTEGVGLCVGGQQTCNLQGVWGDCEASVVPVDEVCNGDDDDCDGDNDEGLNETVTCGLGICQVTVDTCVGGVDTPCLPGNPNPGGETCDGFDDDCDGEVDEGCDCVNDDTQSCYSGAPNTQNVGLCQAGTQTCVNGAWGACLGEVLPSPELCNGSDDNCNGTPDENNPEGGTACTTGMPGVCNPGLEACVGGSLVCQQINMAGPEVCNGADDDCNGTPDDGNPGGGGPCVVPNQMGVCADGIEACQGGTIMCTQVNTSSPEVCNGLDDNCDGTPDDGNPGGGGSCVTGIPGICNAGTLQCNMAVLQCQQNQMAAPAEICGNGLDDDCNGTAEEGCGCPVNQQNCDGDLMGNGCECVGNGCCGTSCQTQHSNGQGQNFYDCQPLGTYDVNQAFAACAASTGNPAQCLDLGVVCDTDLDLTDDSAVVCSAGATDCICWAYSGPAAGFTYNDPGDNGCFCALPGDPGWN